jgi:hypothetical protein
MPAAGQHTLSSERRYLEKLAHPLKRPALLLAWFLVRTRLASKNVAVTEIFVFEPASGKGGRGP